VPLDASIAGISNLRSVRRAGRRSPERIQRRVVGIMAADLEDLSVVDTHQLRNGEVQSAVSMVSGGTHNGHDVLAPHGEIEQLRPERAAAERPLLGQEVVPDGGPAAMRARKGIGPRQMLDRLLVEALRDGGPISSRYRRIQAVHHGHILCGRHHDPPYHTPRLPPVVDDVHPGPVVACLIWPVHR
jgi:hypothetical protein